VTGADEVELLVTVGAAGDLVVRFDEFVPGLRYRVGVHAERADVEVLAHRHSGPRPLVEASPLDPRDVRCLKRLLFHVSPPGKIGCGRREALTGRIAAARGRRSVITR